MNSPEAYSILGIPDDSDLDKIRKAYRQKAKELHPDINKKADAQEKFIEVNEAYEYLIKIKTGKVFDAQSNKFQSSKDSTKTNHSKTWTKNDEKKVRERAKTYSEIHYEDLQETIYMRGVFRISELYPKTIFIASMFVVVFIIIIVPIILINHLGLMGIFGYLLILFLTSPFLRSVYLYFKN